MIFKLINDSKNPINMKIEVEKDQENGDKRLYQVDNNKIKLVSIKRQLQMESQQINLNLKEYFEPSNYNEVGAIFN